MTATVPALACVIAEYVSYATSATTTILFVTHAMHHSAVVAGKGGRHSLHAFVHRNRLAPLLGNAVTMSGGASRSLATGL